MEIKNKKLFLGGVSAESLVKEFGSPLYVYEKETILKKAEELEKAITYPNKKMLYACKANTNASIMKILKEKGIGLDVVSVGELLLALKLGFKAEDILFTATMATDEELKKVIENKVLVNMDSLSEMERFGKLNKGGKCSVRINPEFGAGFHGHVVTGGPDSKFGIYHTDVEKIKKIAEKYDLNVVGVHMHVGSRYLNPDQFYKAMEILLNTAKQFDTLEFVDFGGGIGVVYSPDETMFELNAYGKKVNDIFSKFVKEYGKEVTLMFENGRWYVAESGFLLMTVNTLKETPKLKFAGVDSGMHHMARPALYGAYHEIINASNADGDKEKIVIAGNICESTDLFTRDMDGPVERELPKIKEGDILSLGCAGAYGYTMSSNYNIRERPAEVLVENGKASLIRKRETFDYLNENQII
ncbi:MAG: diaminopimelate decarboxylase [Erythrobacteraceae bacterium]|nr:diaminopimelate decarboxylase [Erythrobacteraceae bacterium]